MLCYFIATNFTATQAPIPPDILFGDFSVQAGFKSMSPSLISLFYSLNNLGWAGYFSKYSMSLPNPENKWSVFWLFRGNLLWSEHWNFAGISLRIQRNATPKLMHPWITSCPMPQKLVFHPQLTFSASNSLFTLPGIGKCFLLK